MQAGLDCLRLAQVRDNAKNFFRFEDLANGHRNGLARNLGQAFEPPLAYLLPPAGFVQLHNQIGRFGFEIRRGIVKGQMAIFTSNSPVR